MDIKAVLFLVLVVFMLAIVFSSIFTMIAMLNGNRTITAIISILSVFLLLLVGTYINARLDEPKMLPAYTSINGSPMYEEDTPNPKYLDKRHAKWFNSFTTYFLVDKLFNALLEKL